MVILPEKPLRQGWAEVFRTKAGHKDDRAIMGQTRNTFDKKEWRW